MKRVMLLAAVVFALSGGVATAGKLITSKDIRNGTITTADLSGSAKRALKGQTGPRGATGVPGPQGPAGPAGPSVTGAITPVSSAQVPFAGEVVQSALALCPAGQKVVSGGGASIADEQLAASSPTGDRSGWFVIGIDLSGDPSAYVQAMALCAPAGKAIAASAPASRQARRQVAALAARIEAQVQP